MKIKLRKFLIILLGVILMMTGCDNSQIDTGTQTKEPTDSTIRETESETTVAPSVTPEIEVTLVKNDVPQFQILFSDMQFSDLAFKLQSELLKKTGTTLDVAMVGTQTKQAGNIYLGTPWGDVPSDVCEQITYKGYVALYSEENIYLCAHSLANLEKCVTKWISTIKSSYTTTDNTGKRTCVLPSSVWFVTDPGYKVSLEGKNLLGNSINNRYKVVLNATAAPYEKEMAIILRDSIAESSGVYLEITTQTAPYGIVFGNSAKSAEFGWYQDGTWTKEMFDYAIKSDGDTLYVGFGGMIAMAAAVEHIKSLVLESDTSAGIDIADSVQNTWLADEAVSLTEGTSVRIMSSNTLFPGEETHDYAILNDVNRHRLLSEFYLLYKPDSIGMQETVIKSIELFNPHILEEYAWVPFTCPYSDGQYWGKTLYRKDKYNLVDYGYVNLDMGNTAARYNFTWALLQNKTTNESYIQGNLHYHWRGAEYSIPQATLVNAKVLELQAQYPGVPIFITGDYNSIGSSEIHAEMKKNTDLMSAMYISKGASDIYANSWHQLGKDGFANNKENVIDHIMVTTESVEVLLHKILHNSMMDFASDHYPVIIDVQIKNSK